MMIDRASNVRSYMCMHGIKHQEGKKTLDKLDLISKCDHA